MAVKKDLAQEVAKAVAVKRVLAQKAAKATTQNLIGKVAVARKAAVAGKVDLVVETGVMNHTEIQ